MDLGSSVIRSPPIPACTTRLGFIPSRSTNGKCDVYRLYNTDFHRSLRSLLDFACLVATVICATDTSNISNLPSQSLRADWMASHVGSIPCGHGGIYLTYSFHRWIIKSGGLSDPSPPPPSLLVISCRDSLAYHTSPASWRKTVALRKVIKNKAWSGQLHKKNKPPYAVASLE